MAKFVKLDEDLLISDAWFHLKPGPRCLYIEMKRKFNGHNNGEIFLSHRDAAELLNVHRNSVGGYFKALEEVGLIQETQSAKSGPSGVGRSSLWSLAEYPIQENPDEKPRRKRSNEAPKFKKIEAIDDDLVLDDEVGF